VRTALVIGAKVKRRPELLPDRRAHGAVIPSLSAGDDVDTGGAAVTHQVKKTFLAFDVAVQQVADFVHKHGNQRQRLLDQPVVIGNGLHRRVMSEQLHPPPGLAVNFRRNRVKLGLGSDNRVHIAGRIPKYLEGGHFHIHKRGQHVRADRHLQRNHPQQVRFTAIGRPAAGDMHQFPDGRGQRGQCTTPVNVLPQNDVAGRAARWHGVDRRQHGPRRWQCRHTFLRRDNTPGVTVLERRPAPLGHRVHRADHPVSPTRLKV